MADSLNPSKRTLPPSVEVQGASVYFDPGWKSPGSMRDSFTALWKKKSAPLRWKALDSVSLRLYPGDRIGILGPNGAGKSTLCRCIAGLLPLDLGHVRCRTRPRAVFESLLTVQPELTGRENAYFLIRFLFRNLTRRQGKEVAEEAMGFSGLGDFLEAPFKTYSHGMQNRLCLSVLSAVPSEILILDEVFQGADAGFQQRIRERFALTARRSGTVIFVSHSPSEIEWVCNRVLVLNHGKVHFDGDVSTGIRHYEELCQHPSVFSIDRSTLNAGLVPAGLSPGTFQPLDG